VAIRLHLTYVSSTGTRSRIEGPEGGGVSFGEAVREDIRSRLPMRRLCELFVRELKGRRSQWPSNGPTANDGPYAIGRSRQAFRVQQARDIRGRFGRGEIVNDARNKSGRPYAGWVNQGIRSGGGRVSASRFMANYNAVAVTFTRVGDMILEEWFDG